MVAEILESRLQWRSNLAYDETWKSNIRTSTWTWLTFIFKFWCLFWIWISCPLYGSKFHLKALLLCLFLAWATFYEPSTSTSTMVGRFQLSILFADNFLPHSVNIALFELSLYPNLGLSPLRFGLGSFYCTPIHNVIKL